MEKFANKSVNAKGMKLILWIIANMSEGMKKHDNKIEIINYKDLVKGMI